MVAVALIPLTAYLLLHHLISTVIFGTFEGEGELREDEIGDHLSDLGTVTGAEHVYRSLSITVRGGFPSKSNSTGEGVSSRFNQTHSHQ